MKKKTRNHLLIMLGCVLVLAAALGGGFYLHVQEQIASAPKPGPETVSTVEARKRQWQPRLSAVGSLTAVQGIEVTTQSSGLVSEVRIDDGGTVEQGDLLVQLSSDADRAQLEALNAAAELAQKTVARDREQLKGNAISKASLDAATADLKGRRAQASQQRALLEQKTIRAPFSGRLGITTIAPGQYIGPGTEIVSLQNLDPVNADFLVPQTRLAGLKPGMIANVTVPNVSGETFEGRITAIDPKVDPQTRNVTVRASVPNPDNLLLPGMFVRVEVDVGDENEFLTLPQAAVTYNAYGSTVFVVENRDEYEKSKDDKDDGSSSADSGDGDGDQLVARQIFVTTGDTRGDQIAILDGISAGQQVVSSGQMKLDNGSPVKIDDSVQPANDPDPQVKDE